MLAKLKSEPVRAYLYSVLVPLLALLLAYGIVDSQKVPLFLALGGAVLGVPAVEAARKRVWPDVKVQAAVAAARKLTVGSVGVDVYPDASRFWDGFKGQTPEAAPLAPVAGSSPEVAAAATPVARHAADWRKPVDAPGQAGRIQ